MIKFNDIASQWMYVNDQCTRRIEQLHRCGDYILGKDVLTFESNFAKWNGNTFSLGVSNGLDGLYLAASALELEGTIRIYIPSNTFIATFLGLHRAYPDASFVAVDCGEDYLVDINLLSDILDRDRFKYDNFIVVPVHLYGKACDVKSLRDILPNNGYIIEDCSQAHGSLYDSAGLKVGRLGDISVFSLYPGKNLGGVGDGGIIVTEKEAYFNRVKSSRNVGMVKKYVHEHYGGNYRLDSLNAIVLDEKLKYLDLWTEKRRNLAKAYVERVKNDRIHIPRIQNMQNHAFHIFCLRVDRRSEFMEYMRANGIETLIHYPDVWYNQKCINTNIEIISENDNACRYAKEIVSIPMHPFVTDSEREYIISVLNNF